MYNRAVMRPAAALVFLALCACLSGGCVGGGPGWSVWAVGDMVQLTDRLAPQADGAWDGSASAVRLLAAANETVAFQFVADAPQAGGGAVAVSVGPLNEPGGGQLGPEHIAVFRMRPVAVTEHPPWYLLVSDGPPPPGGCYDVLEPLGAGEATELPPRGRLALWVDVHVPRTARPGEYTGPIVLTTPQGRLTATLAVNVYDFVLPDIRPVPCLGGFSHEAIFRRFVRPGVPGATVSPARLDPTSRDVSAGLTLMRQLMRLAREHKLDLFDRDLRPLLKRDSFGQVALGWDDFDAVVKPYLDGSAFDDRIGVCAWPLPVGPDWPNPQACGGADSQEYRRTFAGVMARSVQHFEALGAADRAFVCLTGAGAGPEDYRRFVQAAQAVRAAAPKALILTDLSPFPLPAGAPVPEGFAALADLCAPRADLTDPRRAKDLARPDRPLSGLWLRPYVPPWLGGFHLLALPTDVRALPWTAWKYGCAGIFIPEVLDFDEPVESPAGSERRLFYPGKVGTGDAILPSVRLKRLRRGLQDAGYLWLLQQRQRPAVAEEMVGTLVRYAGLAAAGDGPLDGRLDGWSRDPAAWTLARAVLAREVLSAVHPEAISERDLLLLRLDWQRLRDRAGTVRVERVIARVAPAGENRLRATVRADLCNERTAAAGVEIALESLPEGWLAEPPRGVELPGFGTGTVELWAEGPAAAVGAEGKIPLRLDLGADRAPAVTARADAPFLQAGWTDKPLALDGDLSDWPVLAGNCAGRFVLLGRRGRCGEGAARRQTFVFVLRDRKNLYLAFRCEEPDAARPIAQASNTVRYEQAMACGEDLVEVLLDPGRLAAGVGDLYHVVVKGNGVVVAERGVPTDPPLGAHRPWPAGIRSAVGRQPQAWTVELAIPLEDFGQAGGEALWGVNFARFAPAGEESSNWTGAPRCIYGPGQLGTLDMRGRSER